MPQHPAARPTRSDPAHGPQPGPRPNPVPYPRPGGPGHPPAPARPQPDAVSGPVVVPPPAKELTVNKVLAGAGAAATSAVLGSFFGAAGTVAGAALGSVASTVATTVYQRYLDRTRDTIVARIRPVADGTSPSELTLPMQRGSQDETVRLRVEPAVPPNPPRRRRWWVWAGATVLVFAIGLLAVTGLEWVKGSTLTSNDSGTSVGRVLGGERGATAPTTAPSAPSDGSTSEATPDPTTAPSSTADPDQDRTGSTDSTRSPTTESPTPSGSPGASNIPRLPDLPGTGG